MDVKRGSPRKQAMLAGLLGLVLSALLSVWVYSDNRRQLEARLTKLNGDAAELVRQRFGLYEYGLRGARGAVIAAGGTAISRPVFDAYMASRDNAREFPGARGFGFIRRVPRAEEAVFLARARADGAPGFAIRDLGQGFEERFVIQYIHPLDVNRAAMGLDIASEPRRRAAALESARDGQVHLTAPLTLVQADGMSRRGFLALLPVYAPGAPVHSAEAREAATIGWTYAPLLVDEVLAELGPVLEELRITLTDAQESEPFYASGPAAETAPVPFVASRDLMVMGRQWQLRATAQPALVSAARLFDPVWVGMAAACGTSLVALLFWAWQQRRHDLLAGLEPAAVAAAAQVSFPAFLRSRLAQRAGLAC